MSYSARFLSASEAAGRLGVSTKALRLYERHGLVAPVRTAAGWRTYGPDQMARAREVVTLRALGLSLAQIGRVLRGEPKDLESALAVHQALLQERIRDLTAAVAKMCDLRTDLSRGKVPVVGELAHLLQSDSGIKVAFDLPWPWGGERFELHDIRALNYITGPLGCGKTRLARRLAETLANAAFLDMDRSANAAATAQEQLGADPALRSRVEQTMTWLVEDGAVASDALVALLVGLAAESPAILVVDMLEHGLDQPTQEAVIAYLRRRGPSARPLFLTTRSNSILDLEAVGPDEAIILCPANHSPPIRVTPYPGAPGYEAVATCLASPEVRARTEGVIALRPQVA